MNTITVEIPIPDGMKPWEIEQVRLRAESLTNPEWMSVWWHVEDVQEVRPDLTTEQCCEVLRVAKQHHDSNGGSSWETIEAVARNIYGDEAEGEEE